jgi:GTP cyclohydrolase III
LPKNNMSKKIVFKITKDGDVVVDKVEGYGSSCLEATKFIEKALGKADESTRRMTEEYEDTVSVDNSERIRH